MKQMKKMIDKINSCRFTLVLKKHRQILNLRNSGKNGRKMKTESLKKTKS